MHSCIGDLRCGGKRKRDRTGQFERSCEQKRPHGIILWQEDDLDEESSHACEPDLSGRG
jgi:hypothetical protein